MQALDSHFKNTALIIAIGFTIGLFMSWSLFSGDENGRVNLLHLIAVFVFLPITSLVISSSSLFFGNGINLATVLSLLPVWSNTQRRQFLLQKQLKISKWSFFYQSQLAAISFSLASLLVFFLLLVTTDINFVWRSTILSAEQIFPLLDWLASPWYFWDSAKPNLELLMSTQDSRMSLGYSNENSFGDWWPFILSAQIFYAFLLRLAAITVCLLIFKINRSSFSQQAFHLERTHMTDFEGTLDEHQVKVYRQVESSYSLNNWCGIDSEKLRLIEAKLSHGKTSVLDAGPLASYAQQMISERWQEPQLLLVKGWEPPLAELSDFMQNGNGYLMPIDWDDKGLVALPNKHLVEWKRFLLPLKNWKLLQLEGL
jgi:uncharacterized protein DUF2868